MHRILTGFLYPEIGWDVLDVPGQSPMPPVTYRKQEVPPPMNGWVKSMATDADIVFGPDRSLCYRETDGAVLLSSERMFRLLCMSSLMTGLRSVTYHLKRKRDQAKTAISDNNRVILDDFTSAELLKDDSAANCLILFVESHTAELDRASKFETDLVQHVHPNCKQTDKMFACGVIPYCETSHEGMRKVFYKMGENLRLFEMDKDERVCRRLPNAEKRRIYFGTDQLSSRMWRSLRIELTKRLTSLSGAKMVLPMLETLSQITCTHDFLHETRIHRSHAIYVTHYGGFLQAFQCHLRLKEVTGKTRKTMQRHERFCF